MTDAPRPRPSAAPDAADRVVRVHRQTRATLAMAAAFVLAAPLAAVLPHDTDSWLPLHLFLVGGVLGAISGATQMLAVTWSTSPAPSDRLAAWQRGLLGAGALTVAVGRELGGEPAVAGGGVAVAVSLVLLAGSLVGIRRRAATPRFRPAVDAYLAALAFGLVGIAMGIDLATRDGWSSGMRGAHLTVNLLGLVGLVILGTLPFFTATQVRAKMSPRATPAAVRAVVGTAAVAVAGSAVAQAGGRPGVAAVLLLVVAGAVVAVVALLPGLRRRQLDWAGPRLVQLLAGIGWWVVAIVALAAAVDGATDDRAALWTMAIGGYAQIVVASLAYLLPVLRGGGHEHLSSGFATTRSWIGVGAANFAAVGALGSLDLLLALGLGVWVVDGAARGVRLLSGWRRRP